MKTIAKISSLFFMIYFLSGGCAEKMPDTDKLNLAINVVKSYAWFNLMPGGKPSFHFSGEIKIQNNGGDPITNLNLQQITIYDDTLEILKFKPVFRNQGDKPGNDFLSKEVRNFSIASPDKISIEKLNNLKVVNLLLKFSSEDKTFDYKIDSVKIERVY